MPVQGVKFIASNNNTDDMFYRRCRLHWWTAYRHQCRWFCW